MVPAISVGDMVCAISSVLVVDGKITIFGRLYNEFSRWNSPRDIGS